MVNISQQWYQVTFSGYKKTQNEIYFSFQAQTLKKLRK